MTAAIEEDCTLELLVVWAVKDAAKAIPNF